MEEFKESELGGHYKGESGPWGVHLIFSRMKPGCWNIEGFLGA
jgi:hypothetical protein